MLITQIAVQSAPAGARADQLGEGLSVGLGPESLQWPFIPGRQYPPGGLALRAVLANQDSPVGDFAGFPVFAVLAVLAVFAVRGGSGVSRVSGVWNVVFIAEREAGDRSTGTGLLGRPFGVDAPGLREVQDHPYPVAEGPDQVLAPPGDAVEHLTGQILGARRVRPERGEAEQIDREQGVTGHEVIQSFGQRLHFREFGHCHNVAMAYTHGHHESVLRSHTWRTAENSAGYLLPHLRPGLSLLDIGCGPGTITVDLAR